MSDQSKVKFNWLMCALILVLSCVSGCVSGSGFLGMGGTSSEGTSNVGANNAQEVITAALTNMSGWLVPAAVGAIILGGVVFVQGHTRGYKIAGAGLIALVVFGIITKYLNLIIMLATVGGLGLLGYYIYLRMRGWKETISSVDQYLDTLELEEKEKVIKFLKDHQPSEFTQKMIKRIKNAINKKPANS